MKASQMIHHQNEETSTQIKQRVLETRIIQAARWKNTKQYLNANIHSRSLENILLMNEDDKVFFQQSIEKLDISARGCHRILRVSRTIADMKRSQNVNREHISEAIQYRLLDVK